MPYSKEDNEKVTIQECKGIRFGKDGKSGLLVSHDAWDEDKWIPCSLIDDDSECYMPGTDGTLILPRWFVEKESLV